MVAIKKLPEEPENAFELFLGDWKVEWSHSMASRQLVKGCILAKPSD